MTEIVIELNKSNCIVSEDGTKDWRVALEVAAYEIQGLNTLAAEGTAFPRPIECNPESETLEGFLGVVNTPPSDDGMVTVRTDAYEWINVALLPAMPTSFNFILGQPPQVGRVI